MQLCGYGTRRRGVIWLQYHRVSATLMVAVSALLAGAGASGALAQAKKDPPRDAPKVAAKADPAPQSAWVKVCEQATFKVDNRDESKKVCLTHHERLDANTGMVLVSAAIREIEGQPKPSLIIMLPLGMALLPGVQAKIDTDADIIKFPFTFCHPAGCSGEMEASPELIAKLKNGKELMVAAINVSGSPLGFPVPMTGFTPALDGPALDSQKYAEARRGLMDVIKRRQAELAQGKKP
jgi:invasion protein IalB